MRIAPYLVEAMTNHLAEGDRQLLPAMGDHYTHGKYLDQQQLPLDAWANKVLHAAYPGEVPIANNVTELRSA
jgi:hypothetical protein